MRFIRYEIYKEQQPLNIGIMKGLEEIDVPLDVENDLLLEFNRLLPLPQVSFVDNPFSISFFTEEGNRFFHRSIETLITFIEGYEGNTYCVKKIEIPSDNPNIEILYEDEYQVFLNM